MKISIVIRTRNEVLKTLAGRLDGFYLAGGTALSLFYFHHRESYDLDFFTRKFSKPLIEDMMEYLGKSLGIRQKLIGAERRKDRAGMMVYSLGSGKEERLKIDFIEDLVKLKNAPKIVDGIPVMAIEDIYSRKILAVCGTQETLGVTGRKKFIGGRQEAKDFFDLYFLSKTFMPLSKFAALHCGQTQIESVVIWYRTYDRMAIKTGLSEIITDKKFDVREMERHFKDEVENMIRQEL